jgi:hypothetical protein
MLRGLLFGERDRELIEALRAGRYSTSKVYKDIDRVEYSMAPPLPTAIIHYKEDGRFKEAVERVGVIFINAEASAGCPEVLTSSYTNRMEIRNAMAALYRMDGEMGTVLWAPALILYLKERAGA